MEVFYTFRWPPRPRGGRRGAEGEHRGERKRRDDKPAPQAGEAGDTPAEQGRGKGGKPKSGGPRKDRGKDRGKDGGKDGGKDRGKDRGRKDGPRDETPRSYTAAPDRRKDRIDPDNPFAAALMGLRDKS